MDKRLAAEARIKELEGLIIQARPYISNGSPGEILVAKNIDDALGLPKLWHIWCEGYSLTGQDAPASMVGAFNAATFREACEKWSKMLKPTQVHLFDKENLRFFGCQLFDNEKDARRIFG